MITAKQEKITGIIEKIIMTSQEKIIRIIARKRKEELSDGKP